MNDVPCNGCTLCCRNDAVRLLDSDYPSLYRTEPHPDIPGALMLAHQPNGDCVYRDSGGCHIHPLKPQMCREMDCRLIAKKFTAPQALLLNEQGLLKIDIWRRGHELLTMENTKS